MVKRYEVYALGTHVHVVVKGKTVVCGYVVDEINVRMDGPHVGRYLIFSASRELYEANADIVVSQNEVLSLDVVIPDESRCPACREPWWHNHNANCPWWDMMRALGYIP